MSQSIPVEWVEEIPPRSTRISPYDAIADEVRAKGKVAKVATTEGSLNTLANRLRDRFKDLTVAARTVKGTGDEPDQFFVYISLPGKGTK